MVPVLAKQKGNMQEKLCAGFLAENPAHEDGSGGLPCSKKENLLRTEKSYRGSICPLWRWTLYSKGGEYEVDPILQRGWIMG